MLIYMLVFLFVLVALGLVIHFSLDKKVIYKDLKGKHVVITGGSSGIGKAAAVEAARLGANVTVIGRDVGKLTSAVAEITANCIDKSNQKIQPVALDVTSDYKTIEKSFASIEDQLGPIFMLVNCAGMCICGQFEKMEVDVIKQMIDLNYFGTAYPTRYVLSGMKERNEGLIVFVSSEAALVGIYGYSAYSAGKWAVRGLAESVIMEMVGTGVRLTVAFPPDTDTPGLKNEDLTKPEETKLISGSAGLHSAEDVGKQMIHDALVGKTYSVYSLTGTLLSTLFGGSIESGWQVVLQVFSMGLLRIVMLLFLVCLAAATHAGFVSPGYSSPYAYGGWNPYSSYPSQPAVASQHSNILRSPFNLGQVSTYSKSIDTPFSSVRKSDVRVSNPGVAYSPGYSHFASPLVSHVGVAPVAKVATAGLLGVAYSAAPTVSHMTYSNGLGLAYGW